MIDCSTLDSYRDHVLGGRKAIPQLLKLFEKYGVHASWAAVGLMFAENREEAQRYFPEKELQPRYRNEELSSYNLFADPHFPGAVPGSGDLQPYLFPLLLQGSRADRDPVFRGP